MKTIHVLHYLERSAKWYPDKTAVIDEARSCSYKELESACKKVGSALAEKIRIGTPVAVLMEKGIPALYAFWGIVYAGGYYALLNPDLPVSRLRQIQCVLCAPYVITDMEHIGIAREVFREEEILLIDSLREHSVNESSLAEIRDKMIDTDPLYANFTSGSTGIPKGVVVSHRSVIDFIETFTDLFRLNSNDVFGNQAPFDFDVSVKDIYSSVYLSATLVITPKRFFSQPRQLIDWLCERQITTMIWAVSALCLITTFHGLDYRTPTTIRNILFSGETMPVKHLRIWMQHLPDAQYVNLYGPTEITCNCTFHILEKGRDYEDGIPIGRHFPNEHVFLLDEAGHEVTEAGVMGELCVRGTALALGYCRSPEQTNAAFTKNPLHDDYPETIYRTGDLAQYNTDGELMFCGRKDFQIKHMGHRIELEEVERAIASVAGVERCCCLYNAQKQKLYGFYVGTVAVRELHARLREILPVFMIPNAMRQLSAFPLNKNGKIDRKRLLE